jgi:hypothetical protein
MSKVLSRLPDSSMFGLVACQNPLISELGSAISPLLLQRRSQASNPAIVAFESPAVDQLLSHNVQTQERSLVSRKASKWGRRGFTASNVVW